MSLFIWFVKYSPTSNEYRFIRLISTLCIKILLYQDHFTLHNSILHILNKFIVHNHSFSLEIYPKIKWLPFNLTGSSFSAPHLVFHKKKFLILLLSLFAATCVHFLWQTKLPLYTRFINTHNGWKKRYTQHKKEQN